MSFEIFVNGELFTLWETASFSRSIDTPAGQFQFSSTQKAPAQYPVKKGDYVQIMLNDVPMITGYIDILRAQGAKDSGQVVRVIGRDNTQDLIDSSMPDAVKNIQGPISLQALCERVISSINANIEVVDVSSPPPRVSTLQDFPEGTDFTADSGRECMEYLISFARKRQVYLVPDGAGRLQLFRPGLFRATSPLLNVVNGQRNNIIAYELNLDDTQRFNRYRIRSQDNFGSDDNASYDGGEDRSGDATDNEIRRSRYFETQAPESFNEGEVTQTALEVLNIRKSHSTDYTCTVQGSTDNNGNIWDIGQTVQVNDEFADVEGDFIIRAVTHEISLARGTKTVITVAPPEAYQVRETTPTDERKAVRAPKLTGQDPFIENAAPEGLPPLIDLVRFNRD